ncbi:MAG: ExbD/TolR family protein, partial [Candidatus Rokuibacteriota bacterium]
PRDQADERARITVTIDERGSLWIDDQPVAPERFGESLLAAAGADLNAKVVIQGDARLRFGEVRQAMLAVEEAGFHGVGLIAERAVKSAKGD